MKLQRALKQLAKLRESDFVYPDGFDALDQISLQLEKQVQKLANLRPDTRPDTVAGTYNNVLSLLYEVVPMMGFILRSTNVRNAFEAYDPLQRLCKKLFTQDRDVRLILSSDWQFSPITLPMSNYQKFPNLIFIGLPATEGDNVLLMPLAGHELAHSVWEGYGVRRSIKVAVLRHVQKHLRDVKQLDEGKVSDASGRAQALALRQCEEVFCDAFSVWLFGNSAIAAFAYFFAPGGIKRHAEYPPLKTRFEYILQAFKSFFGKAPQLTWGDVEPDAPGGAEDETYAALEAADAAMRKMAPSIISKVKEIATARGVDRPNETNIRQIVASFRCDCPAEGDYTMAEILEAAWQFHEERNATGLPSGRSDGLSDLDALDRLSDMVFKTMEVVEVHRRIAEHTGKQPLTAKVH